MDEFYVQTKVVVKSLSWFGLAKNLQELGEIKVASQSCPYVI